MSKRFPPIPSSSGLADLDAEVEKHHGHNPSFSYKDSNGDPMGPFSILAYTPDLFGPFMALGEAILHQTNLTPRMRELAILAVTAAHPTPFVAYAHARIARKLELPLSTEQTDAACKGATPLGLQDEEVVAYETALAISKEVGTLPEEPWKRAEEALGKERVARLAQVVGFYLYACSLMRMGKVSVPTDEES